jgi:1-deoxy-D-xylulose-5-phosphate synthase
VAIAEQHSVTLAAGLARAGKHAVVAIYSTFLQRAYDQLIHDVAIQNLPVLFAIDRAGIVGADGPTHQGAFDISFLRCIPNMIIMTPADEAECRNMLYTGHIANQPAAVRYPRGAGIGTPPAQNMTAIKLGQSRTMRDGKKFAILNFGTLFGAAEQAANTLDATLIDMRFVKPIDEQAILKAAASHDLLVTLEDGAVAGGAGSAVLQVLQTNKVLCQVLNLGLPDEFIMQGTQQEMYAEIGLDASGIVASINAF